MRVTSSKVVGVMPVRSPQSRQRPFDAAGFLSGNSIGDLRGGDLSDPAGLGTAVRQSARMLLSGKNPTVDVPMAARFLCDFDVLAARIALASEQVSVTLAEVQADLESTARCLAAIDADAAAEIRSLALALRRSSGIVRLVPDQLPEQVLFRLRDQQGPLLRRLLSGAERYKSGCWLRPLTTTGRSWQETVGHLRGNAVAACIDPRGRLLVVDNQRWLECLDLSGSEQAPPFRIGEAEPTGLASDGIFAAIPTREGPVHVIELASGQSHLLVPGGTGATLAVAFVGSGCLASGGTEGRVRLWDVAGGSEKAHFAAGDVTVEALSPLGDNALVVGTDPDEKTRHAIQLWNLRTRQREAAFGRHDWPVTALSVAREADLLVAAANDELSAWRLSDLSSAWRTRREHVTFHALACVSDRVLAADSGGSLLLLDLRDGAEVRRLTPHSGLVPTIAVDAERQRLVTVSYDQSIRLWDTAALEPPGPAGHEQQVSALALTADGDWLLSGSHDGRVLLWDARTGALAADIGRHEHWVSSIAALPDGRAISAGWDGAVRVWDLRGAGPVSIITTGDAHLARLACAPDGKTAVTASTDGAIRVWDLATASQQAMITVPDSRVVAVAADPDAVRWITESGRLASWAPGKTAANVDVPAAGRVTACDLGPPGGPVIVGLVDGQVIAVGAGGSAEIFGGAGCGPAAIARDAAGELVVAGYGIPQVASDNVARMWTDRAAAVLVGDVPWTAAAVAGDGRYLYLGDESGAVHIVEPVRPGLSGPGLAPAGR
jgi:WD40 repeat protein